jgi:two-component system NtrC family sensor kinase
MPRVLGTLWARILIPFALVILTFVVTTVLVVAYMDDVGVEIRVIRTGYLTLALKSKDLARKQEDLREYVASDLVGETNTQRVRIRLESFRKIRTGLVTTVERVVQQLGNLPARHRRRLADTAARLVALQHAIDELDPAYATLATAPPIEATSPNAAPVEPAQAEAGRAALERVKLAEAEITKKATELAEYQERSVTSTARNLEYNANRLRWYTISLSATAVVVGLLVAVWVAIALRPLRRLRAGAQRVGAGDYGARIEETGPAEVSDLAREFNSMGRAIEQRERELVRSERLAAVGKMAAMIAHEVRNPLSAIALNTELMGDELSAEQPEARALCKAIQREVDRLTAITEEYLAFARLPRPKLAPEAVNQVVEQLAAFARDELGSRQVGLELALDPSIPIIPVDAGQLRQCLLNLVRNASEALAGRTDGVVRITTRAWPRRVELAVSDNGPGVPVDVLAHIFDPFFSTKERGSGLGLSLTHQIIRDHGGAVRVRSEPGKGATFTIELPVGAPAVPATSTASDDVAAGPEPA